MKIIHRCATCGYPMEYHPHVRAFERPCLVPLDVIAQQPPELAPTIDGGGRIVETIHEPGTIWPGGKPAVTTHDCPACWELYRELTSTEEMAS